MKTRKEGKKRGKGGGKKKYRARMQKEKKKQERMRKEILFPPCDATSCDNWNDQRKMQQGKTGMKDVRCTDKVSRSSCTTSDRCTKSDKGLRFVENRDLLYQRAGHMIDYLNFEFV